jgi:hypothetical protein
MCAGPVLLIDAPRNSNLTGSWFCINFASEGCFETEEIIGCLFNCCLLQYDFYPLVLCILALMCPLTCDDCEGNF